MNLRTFLAVAMVSGALIGHAQVTVDLELEKDFYIANETMMAQVRITNFSGQTLKFGEDNHWLMFTVEGQNGFLVDQTGDPNVTGEFEIPNASRGTRRVNLAPYYQMSKPGRYQIIATVICSKLKQVLKSPKREVNIIRATTLWEKQFGVPTADGSGVDVRRYTLIRALNDNRLELYIRVASRDDSKVYGVFSVGNMVSFGNPEAQIDRMSRLHLLQQYAARSFRYIVVTADGELMTRHRYDYSRSRPKLGPGVNNLITVVGGVRVPADDDLPPSLESFDPIAGEAIEPPSTVAPDTRAVSNP